MILTSAEGKNFLTYELPRFRSYVSELSDQLIFDICVIYYRLFDETLVQTNHEITCQ